MNRWVILSVLVMLVGVGVFVFRSQLFPTRGNMDQVIKETPSQPTPEEENKQVIVVYSSEGFVPATLNIKNGTSITFKNQSGRQMWVASGPHPTHTGYSSFDQKSAGDTYTFTFTEPGVYSYHNHLSPKDKGSVTVE